jgi:hypothetical protein
MPQTRLGTFIDLRPLWTSAGGEHQDLQNLRTRATLRKKLLDELKKAMQRVASSRAHPRSDRGFALCARKPFRCRPRSRDPLEERLRYATQAEVPCDHFLLAHLSRLQPGRLLAELMKDL